MNLAQELMLNLDGDLIRFSAPRRKERVFKYLLEYQNTNAKRLNGAKVTIKVETLRPASNSTLHAISKAGLKISEFLPSNREAKKTRVKSNASLFDLP